MNYPELPDGSVVAERQIYSAVKIMFVRLKGEAVALKNPGELFSSGWLKLYQI